ncbi:MAG: MBL fold metallo-hydrolase [Alphaproteobacteria bacterium]|nr:MBL fold metallo-hydrolase [Alphaproteobacteria bacterium]
MTQGRSNTQAESSSQQQGARRRNKNRYYNGPVSDHFDGTVFFNPGGTPPKGFGELLKWQLLDRGKKWPDRYDSAHPPAKPHPRRDDGEIHVTMVGHATMLLQAAGLNILTDPVWSDRVSPFSFIGPKRRNAPGIAFSDLPPIDLVLLTHNHYDHLDLATLKRLREDHHPLVLTPLGNDTIIRTAAPDMRMTVGDWGDRVEIGDGVTVHFEPCHHWSARGSRDRRMALWSAFVIETPCGKIYHIGDTGYHDGLHYRAAIEKHGGFKLALLPIGAYEPRWFMRDYHQNPSEAVEGMLACGAEHAVGHHWGSFPLTNEAIEEPVKALAEALESREVEPHRFRALLPGEGMTLV